MTLSYDDQIDIENIFLDSSMYDFNINNFLHSKNNNNNSNDSFVPVFPARHEDIVEVDHHNPKRQNCRGGDQQQCYYYSESSTLNFGNGRCLLPEFPVQSSNVDNVNPTLSAQSIAARERRRKISEKTRELGKIVPGGSKMNTAEMLHAGFKYVKYLQAQIGILKLMGSLQVMKKPNVIEEMQIVGSTTIQEKLYMENKCLVPRQFITFTF